MNLKNILLAFALTMKATFAAVTTQTFASVTTPALGSLNKSGPALFSTSTFTPALIGYQFTALVDMKIVTMGVFDSGGDGLAQTADLGIYDLTGALLRRVAVPSSSPLRGDFRYAGLADPLVVAAGTSLRLAHHVNSVDPWVFRADTSLFSPLIQYNGSVSNSIATQLAYPNSNFSSRREYLGTDFEFEVVPEPSTCILFSLSTFLLFQRRRQS
jgi:hypothetical protein